MNIPFLALGRRTLVSLFSKSAPNVTCDNHMLMRARNWNRNKAHSLALGPDLYSIVLLQQLYVEDSDILIQTDDLGSPPLFYALEKAYFDRTSESIKFAKSLCEKIQKRHNIFEISKMLMAMKESGHPDARACKALIFPFTEIALKNGLYLAKALKEFDIQNMPVLEVPQDAPVSEEQDNFLVHDPQGA
jgi:hypothetical protein